MRILGEPEEQGQGDYQREERGGNVRMGLGALFIILLFFGYLYFFTDLIRSHGEPQPDRVALVRKPLPPRGGMGVMTSARKVPIATDSKVGSHSKPAVPTLAVKNASPVKAPASGALPSEPKQAETVPAAKPATKKPGPGPAVPDGRSPSSGAPASGTTGDGTVGAKPAPTTSTPLKAGTTTARKPDIPVSAKPQTSLPGTSSPPVVTADTSASRHEPAAEKAEGRYLVQCGLFVTAHDLASTRSAVKKAGLTPAVTPGPKQPMTMFRLFVAGFSDADVAAGERKKLLALTRDAFVLPRDGNHELFAGSYHEEARALKEQGRLAGQGVKTIIQKVTVPVATKRLTTGPFTTKVTADAALVRLKRLGRECTVSERGH